MAALINSFTMSSAQFIGMAALLVVTLMVASLGAVVAGPNRRREGDLIFGWAVASSVFTVVGTLKLFSFTQIAIGLGIFSLLALVLLWRRQAQLGPPAA